MQWMAWTAPTAVFFAVVALAIAGLTAWAALSPPVPRRGLLPMVTTRGDRFFIGLLGSAYINLAWIGLTELSQWGAVAVSALWMLFIARWG